MAGGEEKDKSGGGAAKGFAGLSSLVSNVDMTPPPVSKPTSTGAPDASKAAQSSSPKPLPLPYPAPKAPPHSSSGGKWLLGLIIGAGILSLIVLSNSPPSAPTSAYPPSTQVSSYATPSTAAPEPQTPSLPVEEMPPVGSDTVLSMAQIRYCLAEDIRIDAAKSAVDSADGPGVDHFNTMVEDFNSRCGSFRYRSGALESARAEIEPYRSELIVEGRSRLMSKPQSDPQSGPAQVDASQQTPIDEPPLDAQSQSQGIDGLTVTAPHSELSDQPATPAGLIPNTAVDVGPMDSTAAGADISEPPANSWVSGSQWFCKEGFRKVGNQCEALVVPDNAFVSGSNWYCKEGFRKVRADCEALVVPENAFVSGANWYCKEGFRKVEDQCEALVVPVNAFVSGSNWYCKEGFRKVGNECEALVVPDNAFVSGANWYCNEGFRKVVNKCEALVVPDNAFISGSNWYCKEGFRKDGDTCVSIFGSRQ